MTIFLPIIRPEDSIFRKIGIILFNWFAWILPAWGDAVATDVGGTFQDVLTFIVAFWAALTLTLLLFGLGPFDLEILFLVGLELAIYLSFGIFYHLHKRSWKM